MLTDVPGNFFGCKYDVNSAEIPDCLKAAGEWMAKRASGYAEVGAEEMKVEHVEVLAYLTEGSKKVCPFCSDCFRRS